MTREEMMKKLKSSLTEKRYNHSLNVMDTCVELAKMHDIDTEKAAIAGLLHDCAKDIKGESALRLCSELGIEPDDIERVQPVLLHGILGKNLAQMAYGIYDEVILKAIEFHTTGCENMDMMGKIVYIADWIEPARNFPGINKLRKLAFRDIERAVSLSLDMSLKDIIRKGKLIHPNTIKARNYQLSTVNLQIGGKGVIIIKTSSERMIIWTQTQIKKLWRWFQK
jgi:predicted HD superfamily hydrolase involved in NAD metabolism